jgi:iron complex outermembrane receptor protein
MGSGSFIAIASALAVAVGGGAQIAHAQEQAVEEIVVVAQHKEEKLQQVPIAITALAGDTLGNGSSADLRAVATMAPSLTISSYPNSSDTVSLYMRGQGIADAGQITRDGGVGLYVDGFFISRPQAALFDIGDPERVEILRGPQGTLYGRNTTGGAINIITRKPTGELGGQWSVSAGSRGLVRTVGVIDLPAFGNLALRGSIVYSNQAGWVKNIGEAHDFHEMGNLAGRIAARWTPTSNLTVDYAWDHGRVSTTQPYYVNPDLVGIVPGYTGSIHETPGPLDLGESRSHFTDHQLTIAWKASDRLTLRSLSSYRKSTSGQDVNYGYGQSYPIPGYTFTVAQQHHYRSEQYTQEIQALGSIGEAIDFTGGLYYFKETATHDQGQQLGLPPILGGYTETTANIWARSISKAAYLQVTVIPPIFDNRIKLTVGGRYTDDQRTATRSSYYFNYQLENGARNQQSFDNFSPMANLAVQWTPDIMTYVKYSRSYKSGGSGESAPNFVLGTFRPEKVEAWEVGLKSQFLDRAVTFNAALFSNKFKDIQLDFAADPIDLSKVSTINAGRASIKGAEFEVVLRPVRGLTINASYSLLDPSVDYVGAPAGTLFDPAINEDSTFTVGQDVTGYFTIPFAPKHAYTIGANWTVLDDGQHTLTASANYTHQDGVYTSAVAGPQVPGYRLWKSDATKLLNGRLQWTQPLSGVDVTLALFANNLLDRRAKGFVIGIGSQLGAGGFFSQTAPYSEPRVIGGELKLKF